MKTVIIYKSKTNFKKKYADWIAGGLSADVFEVSKVDSNTLLAYDTVIYGDGLHTIGINGEKFLKENLNKLEDRKVVLYATGAAPSKKKTINEALNLVRQVNLTN
jgi:menaquinone-dependent protoporphyrinogen IX oxidase